LDLNGPLNRVDRGEYIHNYFEPNNVMIDGEQWEHATGKSSDAAVKGHSSSAVQKQRVRDGELDNNNPTSSPTEKP